MAEDLTKTSYELLHLAPFDVWMVLGGKLVEARRRLVLQAAKSPTDLRIINEHGYNITQEDIDLVKQHEDDKSLLVAMIAEQRVNGGFEPGKE